MLERGLTFIRHRANDGERKSTLQYSISDFGDMVVPERKTVARAPGHAVWNDQGVPQVIERAACAWCAIFRATESEVQSAFHSSVQKSMRLGHVGEGKEGSVPVRRSLVLVLVLVLCSSSCVFSHEVKSFSEGAASFSAPRYIVGLIRRFRESAVLRRSLEVWATTGLCPDCVTITVLYCTVLEVSRRGNNPVVLRSAACTT